MSEDAPSLEYMAAKQDSSTPEKLRKTAVNYRTALIAGCVVVVGVLVLWASAGLGWFGNHASTKAVADQLGGILITTGGLAILWDLRGRRDIIDEVLAKVELSSDLETTGLQRASMDWRVVPWNQLISEARQIDVFIAYGSTWLSNNISELRAFAENSKNKMRFFLPDPEDEAAMAVLAQRFDYTPEVIRSKIIESAQAVAKISSEGKADIRVWYRMGAPTFTCYRFDGTVVVTLYAHKLGRGLIPTFVMNKGTLGEFFEGDLDALESQGREVGRNVLLGEGS